LASGRSEGQSFLTTHLTQFNSIQFFFDILNRSFQHLHRRRFIVKKMKNGLQKTVENQRVKATENA
jgi:hypothetical protein